MPDPESPPRIRSAGPAEDPFDWFIRIPNRLELMKPVRDLVAATCQSHGADEEALQELLLAVTEIVNNSIEHVAGRGEGGYHEVDFHFGVRDRVAVGRIVDEGEDGIRQGDFDGAQQPSLDCDRGRGLLLIRVYLDEVRVREVPGVGTEIRFVKDLRGEGGSA